MNIKIRRSFERWRHGWLYWLLAAGDIQGWFWADWRGSLHHRFNQMDPERGQLYHIAAPHNNIRTFHFPLFPFSLYPPLTTADAPALHIVITRDSTLAAAAHLQASLFDVSHMCSIRWSGKDAVAFLEHVTVCDVAGLPINQGTLSVITTESGGVVDDTMITKCKCNCTA